MTPEGLPGLGTRRGQAPVRIAGRPVLVVVETPTVAALDCGDDPGDLTAEDAVLVLGAHQSCPPHCRPLAGALAVLADEYRTDRTAHAPAPRRFVDALDHQLAELVRQWLAAVHERGR
ncbi:hypothetical protein [Nocardia sp. NPDC005366]|uniref:hypothetical protein n=1 Tax=Nocardia sp. NPDC005366 TaxID=3156878 RepID=UPI0033A9DBFC